VTLRTAVVPWLGGGLLVFGYAALWLRTKRSEGARLAAASTSRRRSKSDSGVEHLSSRLQRVPEGLASELESQRPTTPSDAPPRSAVLGALFLGRASEALSAFHSAPDWPSTPR
jgi:hypothetical protein